MTQALQKPEDTPGYVYNFAVDLGNGTQFTISGNFPKGATKDDMNQEVDKLRAVSNRQQARSSVIAIEQEIMKAENGIKDSKKDYEDAVARQAKKPHVSQQDKMALEQHATNIRHREEALRQTKELLEKLRKEAE